MKPGASVAALIGAALAVAPAGASSAERDLATELVGTWQGSQQQIGGDRSGETTSRERTLVIRSVKRSGEGWSVDASFGVSGEKLARFRNTSARLQESGPDVTLTLTYATGTYVSLRLSGKDWLQGAHHSRGHGTERTLSLKRVSSTPAKQE